MLKISQAELNKMSFDEVYDLYMKHYNYHIDRVKNDNTITDEIRERRLEMWQYDLNRINNKKGIINMYNELTLDSFKWFVQGEIYDCATPIEIEPRLFNLKLADFETFAGDNDAEAYFVVYMQVLDQNSPYPYFVLPIILLNGELKDGEREYGHNQGLCAIEKVRYAGEYDYGHGYDMRTTRVENAHIESEAIKQLKQILTTDKKYRLKYVGKFL